MRAPMHRAHFLHYASTLLFSVTVWPWLSSPCAAQEPISISPPARKLHFHSVVVDAHADTAERLLTPGFDLAARHSDGNIDVPRMREGGLGVSFFSILDHSGGPSPEAYQRTLHQIERVRSAVTLNSKDLVLATSVSDVRRAHAAGKIAILLAVEGGNSINNDLDNLRTVAARGVRLFTVTYAQSSSWADSVDDEHAPNNGLSDLGKKAIAEMNRLGVVVDVSHISDKAFYDALTVSQAPIVASHSSCRAISGTRRNLSDDMIRALAAKGGVIDIAYYLGYLSDEYRNAFHNHPEVGKAINDEVTRRCGEDAACQQIESERLTREAMEQGKLPRVDWTIIVDHIEHVVKIAGVDHVGLGSDFDGAELPFGMEDATHLPQITNELLKRGYSAGDIQKILGGNTLRVLREAEITARQLAKKAP